MAKQGLVSSSDPALSARAARDLVVLRQVLGRLDTVLFIVAAMVALEILGQVATYGPGAVSWLVLLVPLFMMPYELVVAELSAAFPVEGGPYTWMRLAFGKLAGAIGSVVYWITNPIALGGYQVVVVAAVWSQFIRSTQVGSAPDYVFKIAFIWLAVTATVTALRYGRWIPDCGAVARIAVIVFFTITLIIYAIRHGLHGFGAHGYWPFNLTLFIGVVPILLFNLEGFELPGCAAGEIKNPQINIPRAILRSGSIAVLGYGIPVLGIMLVLPKSALSGITGFMQAIQAVFGVYGAASSWLVKIMALGFVFSVLTEASSWMIGADRAQAVASLDGSAPFFFGHFSARLGTPVRVNMVSGLIATAFMVFTQVDSPQGTNATFNAVLDIAASISILGYLLMFPAAIALRYKYKDVRRPFSVPGGNAGMWLAAGACTFWTIVGAGVTLYPGVLQEMFGQSYSVTDNLGMSRTRFEVFAGATLGVIILIGVAGFLLARRAQRSEATVETTSDPKAESG